MAGHKTQSVTDHKTGYDETISNVNMTSDISKVIDKNVNVSDHGSGLRVGGGQRKIHGLHSSGYVCIGKTCQGLMNLDFDALEDEEPKHKHHHHSKKHAQHHQQVLLLI